jgi:hypothetical protein
VVVEAMVMVGEEVCEGGRNNTDHREKKSEGREKRKYIRAKKEDRQKETKRMIDTQGTRKQIPCFLHLIE